MMLTFKISLSPSLELKGNHFKLTKWLPTQQVWCTHHSRVSGVTWFKMVALDTFFHRANLTPQQDTGFRANSAIFLFFFPSFFIMDSIQGRNWKVGLDENTGAPYRYKTSISNKTLNFVSIAWGEVRRGYSLHVPVECLYQAMQTR